MEEIKICPSCGCELQTKVWVIVEDFYDGSVQIAPSEEVPKEQRQDNKIYFVKYEGD